MDYYINHHIRKQVGGFNDYDVKTCFYKNVTVIERS